MDLTDALGPLTRTDWIHRRGRYSEAFVTGE
jgi:hypothetical protein